jgi:hypothetical protein
MELFNEIILTPSRGKAVEKTCIPVTILQPIKALFGTQEKYRNRKTSGIEMAYPNNPMGI